jgi:hypothetical protein
MDRYWFKRWLHGWRLSACLLNMRQLCWAALRRRLPLCCCRCLSLRAAAAQTAAHLLAAAAAAAAAVAALLLCSWQLMCFMKSLSSSAAQFVLLWCLCRHCHH